MRRGTREQCKPRNVHLKARYRSMYVTLPFARDFLGWKCLSRHWMGYPKFRIGCKAKPTEFQVHVHVHAVFSPVPIECVVGMHILGGASDHIKAIGSTPIIPHQSKTSSERIGGQYASSMLGRTLMCDMLPYLCRNNYFSHLRFLKRDN